jgi:hypothetical protein
MRNPSSEDLVTLRACLRLAAAAALAASAPAAGAPPPEGECPRLAAAGGAAGGSEEDALGPALREGEVVGIGELLKLQTLLPPEVWLHREAFFFEGMRLEIGACHRRFPVPAWYSHATLAHWEKARLDDSGNLRGYVAGLPFPPDRIDPASPDAGARWAWNLELRHRGAGPAGRFRITDMPSRVGGIEIYEGSFFMLQTSHRADLAASRFAVPDGSDEAWVFGGRFDEPFHARHLAWRQLRPGSTLTSWRESDQTWVYVPDMRKPRRAATAWVDGLYLPRYSSSQQIAAGGGVPFAHGERIEGANVTASVSAAATENIRRGFVGLALRPNAHQWTLQGERDVLAPLNANQPGWPDTEERNFGPSGLSVASDRWDVRRAVVLEGVARREVEGVARITLYVDWQTQQPLYYIARRKNGLLVDVGIFVHRFSGDVAGYPTWPTGERALVFDPVAATFYTAIEGGTGWRRESYDVRSVPPSDEDARRMTSVIELDRGH